jgi:hypothetical protein
MSKDEAGPLLDSKIAEMVFGLTPCDGWERVNFGSAGGPALMKRCEHLQGRCYPSQTVGSINGRIGGPPRYSSDYGAAMQVFEALVEMTGYGSITADMEDARGEGFVVSIVVGFDDAIVNSTGPLPLAICRAAIAACTLDRPRDGAQGSGGVGL